MTGSHIIELRDVRFAYRTGPVWSRRTVPVLHDIDLRIARGETLGLVGESGSGKSTIAKLSLGLLRPSSGVVSFDGGPMPGRAGRAGRFAAVLQHPMWSLNPRLKVVTSILEPLQLAARASAGAHRTASGDRVHAVEMLERVGLDAAFADRYPHELSGGQRQRVSIARALVTSPDYVLFDEAVSALDVSVQAQILNLIRTLQAEHSFAALFISHDLAAVRYVADEVAVLSRGSVVDRGKAKDLYAPAAHPYTRQLQEASEL